MPIVPILTVPALAAVFDDVADPDLNPVVGAEVRVTLDNELNSSGSTAIRSKTVRTLTDNAGRWVVWLVATDVLTPDGSTYTVVEPRMKAYRIAPITPTPASEGDPDSFQVPRGENEGTWVAGQRARDIAV